MLDIASMPARATKTTASRPEGRSGNPREVEATGVRLRGLATRGCRLRPFPRMSQAIARQRGPTVRGAGCCPPDVFVFVPELRPGRSQRVSPLRTPDSRTPRSLRRRSAVARLSPPGVLRRHHRDRLRHVRSPSRGSRRPRSSERTGGLRGPNASSPISPHAGGLSGVGDRHSALWSATRGSGVVPPTRARARVKLPSAPSAPRQRRPDGRTSGRFHRVHPQTPFVARGCSPAPGPRSERGVTRRRRVDRRSTVSPQPVTGRERRDLTHLRLAFRRGSGRAPLCAVRGVATASVAAPEVIGRLTPRVAPWSEKWVRAWTSSSPFGGRHTASGVAGGEGRQRGSCCRVPVDVVVVVAWEGHRHKACLRRRSRRRCARPAWCGLADRSQPSCGAFAASYPGFRRLPITFRRRAFERSLERRIESFVRPRRAADSRRPSFEDVLQEY